MRPKPNLCANLSLVHSKHLYADFSFADLLHQICLQHFGNVLGRIGQLWEIKQVHYFQKKATHKVTDWVEAQLPTVRVTT